jgi:uncharacterized protein YdeI (YjbR/CyaY-like superfamily)
LPELTCQDAAAWAAWLEEHHTTEAEVWLLYWKKATGKESIVWADAVEVALRFGWIDGIVRTIDDERYMQRWTPRRAKSRWSLVNKNTALRLIAEERMSPAGLASVDAAKASGEWERAYTVQKTTPLPPDLKEAIARNPEAKAAARRLSRTRHERWLAWLDGTEGVTRKRRINRIVRALAAHDLAALDEAARKMR